MNASANQVIQDPNVTDVPSAITGIHGADAVIVTGPVQNQINVTKRVCVRVTNQDSARVRYDSV